MKSIVFIGVIMLLGMFLWHTSPAEAVQSQASPPTSVTVTMYELYADGASKGLECSNGNINLTHWGCTAYCDNIQKVCYGPTKPYPFVNNRNPITVDIEGNDPGDLQHGISYNRYLRDVVPEEVAIKVSSRGNKPLSTLKAQAIAARTYVYFRQGLTINNSSQYQVFVPYYYDTLTSAQQQRVDEAVSDVWYMTLPNSTDPIDALYGADNRDRTSQGTPSYLKSVADPINAQYGCAIFDDQGNIIGYHKNSDPECGTGNGGMSSRGASRWGFGHTSSRGPDEVTSPHYPHDSNGDGDFWSVRYDRAEQILTHYYTGIHIRDASGAQLTSAYRWNALQVNNAPTQVPPGHTSYVSVWLQNTGTASWFGSGDPVAPSHALSYRIFDMRGTCVANCSGTNRAPLDEHTEKVPGDDLWRTLQVYFPSDVRGPVVVRLDMVQLITLAGKQSPGSNHRLTYSLPLATSATVDFWFADYGWYTQDIHVCVGSCTFLPLIEHQF